MTTMDNAVRSGDLHLDLEAFNTAIKIGDFDKVRILYQDGFVNVKDKAGVTSLHYACGRGRGDINIVKYLLDKGFDIEAETTEKKYRPIHLAAICGLKTIVEELINRGCEFTALTAEELTAIEVALRSDKKEVANIFYEELKMDSNEAIDEYLMEIKLGIGSFGVVYKARHKETDKYFAIKEVNTLIINELVESVKKEIEIYKTLPLHSNVVRYHTAIKGKYDMNIIMEYIDGGTLRSKLNEVYTLSINNIVFYTIQILDGIDFLHKNNIIHRDIKSSNLLIDKRDVIKLCDFGSSRFLKINKNTNETGNTSDIEMATTSAGTEFYMAPEVFNGTPYSFPADIWSLGATVFEMFTGLPPYHDLGKDIASYMIAELKIVEYNPNIPIPDNLRSFMDSMFVADPDERANVEDLLKSNFLTERNVLLPSVNYSRDAGLRSGIFGDSWKYLDERINKYFVMREINVPNDFNDIYSAVKSLRINIINYQQLSIHRNIAQYYGTIINRWDILCIGTEYVDAGSLRDKLDKETKLPENIMARYTKQILEGLKFLHLNNIIHGSIKAANVMLDSEDNVKLCDFGIYTQLNRIQMEYMDELETKQSYWMAPEINIGDALTSCSDVWSLGATVVEMVSGRPPYYDRGHIQARIAIRNAVKVELNPEIPISDNLQSFMDSMFVADPDYRANVETLLKSKFITEKTLLIRSSTST